MDDNIHSGLFLYNLHSMVMYSDHNLSIKKTRAK